MYLQKNKQVEPNNLYILIFCFTDSWEVHGWKGFQQLGHAELITSSLPPSFLRSHWISALQKLFLALPILLESDTLSGSPHLKSCSQQEEGNFTQLQTTSGGQHYLENSNYALTSRSNVFKARNLNAWKAVRALAYFLSFGFQEQTIHQALFKLNLKNIQENSTSCFVNLCMF